MTPPSSRACRGRHQSPNQREVRVTLTTSSRLMWTRWPRRGEHLTRRWLRGRARQGSHAAVQARVGNFEPAQPLVLGHSCRVWRSQGQLRSCERLDGRGGTYSKRAVFAPPFQTVKCKSVELYAFHPTLDSATRDDQSSRTHGLSPPTHMTVTRVRADWRCKITFWQQRSQCRAPRPGPGDRTGSGK